MLRYSLSHLFKARGIEKPSQFLINLGFSAGTATKIRHGRSNMLSLRHIELLCEHLKCTPNDLLEWTPSGKQQDTPNHPLAPLKNRDKAETVVQLINQLSYDKLQKVEELLKSL